jgi:hypothetical protein
MVMNESNDVNGTAKFANFSEIENEFSIIETLAVLMPLKVATNKIQFVKLHAELSSRAR